MFINTILFTTKSLNSKWSLTSPPTKLPTLTYYIDGQAAKQKCLYLHPAGQFLIQANSRSAGKEASVLNGARSFIIVFTKTYHWVMSTHYFYNKNFNIIVPFTSQIFRVCYKRHPSHLTDLHAIKIYNFVYARNETQKILKLILVLL
jgi:hypothetical protein